MEYALLCAKTKNNGLLIFAKIKNIAILDYAEHPKKLSLHVRKSNKSIISQLEDIRIPC